MYESHGESREQEIKRVGGTYIQGMGRRKVKNGWEGRRWDWRVNEGKNLGLPILWELIRSVESQSVFDYTETVIISWEFSLSC